jgi:glycosyltransferase involved in cell wall biosynthesis
MKLLGLIPEPPFDPRSWSGSSVHFFRALQRIDLLADACHVAVTPLTDLRQKALAFGWPLPRWREQYHSSVARFRSLTRAVATEIARHPEADAILQIGAWFSAPVVTSRPCYSYHDGNAALWYRYYGRGLLSDFRVRRHLDWERKNYARMRGIFVMSQWLASSFVQDFGVPEHRLHVVGAGINFERLPEKIERDFSTPRFLLIGRDFIRKGGKYLLEAFRIVRKGVPTAELTIVGPDTGVPEPGVRYAGFLRKNDPAELRTLSEIFCASTAMVLPSVYEPFGISLLEGMANYLPCIAVDRCALPEIVAHEDTGLIAKPEDSQSLADAMIELARNPDTARRMGEKGRQRVEEHYTWDAVVSKIQEVLAARRDELAAAQRSC